MMGAPHLAGRKLDHDLPRLDVLSPALIEKQQAAREAQRRAARHQRAPAPLHVAFQGSVALGLAAAAETLDATPQTIAAALLRRVFDDDLVGALLAGERPEKLAGGQGRRAFGDERLTLHQCALVYQIGLNGGMRGGPGCKLSEGDLAGLLHVARATVAGIISSLVGRGVLVSSRPSFREDRIRRLTETGQAVFEVLAGEADD